MRRTIDTNAVVPLIRDLFIKACCELDGELIYAYKKALDSEESPLGKEIISTLIENAGYAKNERIACCQDTGAAIVFLEIGQEVCWTGDTLSDSVNEGVRQGYEKGYLRKSMVRDPFLRENSNDNTPAIIHTEITAGDKVRITVLPKGAGSENMSRCAMLTPAQGIPGVRDFVVETVKIAGGNACPPLIVGVGIGGTIDSVTWISKKTLFRGMGTKNAAPRLAEFETELLTAINNTGIGPMGLGGRVTALEVRVEVSGCHFASLPVSVSLQCHAARHASAEI